MIYSEGRCGIHSGETFAIWHDFPGGGGGRGGGGFPCDTGVLLGGNACFNRYITNPLHMHDNVYFIHRYRRNK